MLECPLGQSKLTAVPSWTLPRATTLQRTVPIFGRSSSRDRVVTHTRHRPSVVRYSTAAETSVTATVLLIACSSAADERAVTDSRPEPNQFTTSLTAES